jgi:hypothetical protein
VPGLTKHINLEKAREGQEKDQVRMRKYAGGVKIREPFQPGDKVVFKESHKGKDFSKREDDHKDQEGGT